jgi:deoxycytidylate deaminase
MDDVERLTRDLLDRDEAAPAEAPVEAFGEDVWTRPEHLEYFMGLALAVRERANCQGRRVGAVLVVRDRVIATGSVVSAQPTHHRLATNRVTF